MIISIIQGGLGNQMFQYACGLCISHQYSCPLRLVSMNPLSGTKRRFELNIFDFDNKIDSSDYLHKYGYRTRKIPRLLQRFFLNKGIIDTGIHIQRSQLESIPEIDSKKGYLILEGYWQNEKYFFNVSNEIRNIFSFTDVDDTNQRIASQIHSEESVSIHVRRTDFINHRRSSRKHDVVPLGYYADAVKLIKSKYLNPKFFVFSDDINWVKENMNFLPRNSVYVSHNKEKKSYMDMYLMSLCKSNIIANSSFSWWGAWLGGSKLLRIAPKKWTNKIDTKDVVPVSWRII